MAKIFKSSPNKKIFLASASPRRSQLLSEAGIPFSILKPACLEEAPLSDELPQQYALRMAKTKAEAGRILLQDIPLPASESVIVIGCDTIVSLDQHIFGKPDSFDGLMSMLKMLNGRIHTVFTAVYMWGNHSCTSSFVEHTQVQFAAWPESVLTAYAVACSPLDKAGGYGIQDGGGFLIQEIAGSWTNVVGLPLSRVLKELLEKGIIESA